ncbi:MAG: hypothetical protein GY719_11445 [bacterium]|nr:hypothetical protein [bacterium]
MARVRRRYERVVVILSTARSGSTPLSRVFWEHAAVRHYCHEPFEVTYFDGEPFAAAIEKLMDPIDLMPLKQGTPGEIGHGLVVKEMTYQVGAYAPDLMSLATGPIVFLLRDPLLAVHSRYRKKRQVGDRGIYPGVEMGVLAMSEQIATCRERGIPYLLVDSADFRRQPSKALRQVFERLDLPFSQALLDWRPLPDFDLDNLDGRHSHLYTRVLMSTGIQPDNAPPRTLDDFPEEDGFRSDVAIHAEVYRQLLEDPNRILIG